MSVPRSNNPRPKVYHSIGYIFYPRVSNHHSVIIHAGHNCRLDGRHDQYNIDVTIRSLLKLGYRVVGIRMPLYQNPSHCGPSRFLGIFDGFDHNSMFEDGNERLQAGKGSPLQFFLEPVAQVLNYMGANDGATNFNMIGISGGGWTTTVYSALDPRILLSFPVAGSAPLFLPDATRDDEQKWPDFYSIAGYKDLYVLGSYGPGRRQTQILNRHDDCCFHPTPPLAYGWAREVQIVLSCLGSGTFVLDYDDTAHTHQIPLAAISGVIIPTLNGGP